MKKRMLSILLTLCMVLCLAPAGVFAEGETTKKVETEQELVDALADNTVLQSVAVQSIGPNEAEVENDLYEKMSLQVSVITLINDIELNGCLSIDYEVTIDLNGHVLKIADGSNDRVIKITKDGHLILTDGRSTAEHNITPNADGLWVLDEAGGTEIVKGGIITGGNTGGDDGGGVYIEPGGRFTMNGGSIVGCQARSQYNGAGGGVKVECETDPDSGIISNGTFTMNGGAIIGCVARHGGGVEINRGSEGEYGTFTMNGGVIDSCVAADGIGGGVQNDGIFIMGKGGTIKNCKAFQYDQYDLGSGVSLGGDRNILNGTIISGDVVDTQHIFVNGPVTIGADADIRANMFSYGHTIALADGVISATIYGKITNDSYGGASCYADGLAVVTYQVDGADYAMQILRSGTTALKPDEPAAEDGYVFAGWFGGDTPYDFTNPVTEDITLTAKWAKLVDKTADFTAPDGGAAAIALLNSTKNGAEDSAWDNGTKTLTLKGVSMATTATTAVKLPDGATVILSDGTENHIIGGDTAVTQEGDYKTPIYIYGIYAAGALTIQGETSGTGAIYVKSGEHINSGDAWTYSAALYADGDFEVKSGSVTAQGGKAVNGDCAFSFGVQLSEGHSLSVSGGTLTAVGGESFDAEDPSKVRESFSEGFDIYRGNVTASGSGKIIGKTISEMINKDLSYGFRIVYGNINVSDSAALTATSTQAICISYGDIKLSGGKLSAFNSSDHISAITISSDHPMINFGNGNIEITGGELECVGGIYMSVYPKAEGKCIFSVTNGKVTTNKIYGPDKLKIAGGTVKSGKINADTVELQSGSLTVREPVRKYPNRSDVMYASHAIYCENLTVSGGVLDAAWDWGEYTPIAFPASWYSDDYVQPLIRIPGGTASFSGGTVKLDTGCSGNTAIKTEKLNLSGGVRGSGYTNESGSDLYIQKDGGTPLKFVVYPANYTKVNAALNKAKTLDKSLYKDFSAVEAAVNAVVRGKNIDEQAVVDAMAQAIEEALAALEYKDADYSKANAAIEKANALNKDEYKDFTAVEAAVNAVVRGKNITEQAVVDAMAQAIETALAALEYKDADYSKVNAAIEKANALNKDEYKDFTAVETAINAVVRGKNITEQAVVDAMAQAIETALAALEYKDADYSKVNAAIEKANALNKDEYKDFTAVETAINAVVRGKNITEQSAVDDMAKAIENAINALEIKPAEPKPEPGNKSPKTGDSSNPLLWIALLFIGGGITAGTTVMGKKKRRFAK